MWKSGIGGFNLMSRINFLEGLTLTSLTPLFFSTFTEANQLLNWHNNVINCFLVIGPTEFYTVKKCKSGVYLQAIECSRSKKEHIKDAQLCRVIGSALLAPFY